MNKQLIVQAIKEGLVTFGSQDLCDGNAVRDMLLDLLLLTNDTESLAEYDDDGIRFAEVVVET